MKTDHKDIATVGEWTRVSEIPSRYSPVAEAMNEDIGMVGVYQVAAESELDNIGDSIVHPEVLYTGKSKDIHARTYNIRQPGGSHGASRYMREHKLDREKYYVRILYTTVDPKDLEKEIHDASEKKFGNRFKWKEASAGNDGNLSKVLDLLNKLSVDDLLTVKGNVKDAYLKRSEEEALQQWEEEV